ncbi:MAG: Panacea domain-containing protein [Candidatus Rokuibacteriota bacterium]
MTYVNYRFRFKPEKFVEAVSYLLSRVGPSARMRIVKLLYLADRTHLVRHGTPILGDRYYRLPFGPIPSRALDLLEAAANIVAGDREVAPDAVSDFLLDRLEIVQPDSKYPTYRIRRPVERTSLDFLSASEIEALDIAVARYGRLQARELSDLSHRHDTYTKTEPTQEIDYQLFFSDEPDANPEALRYLLVSQEDRELVEKLRSLNG